MRLSTEKNISIVRRLWDEVWNQNNLAVCDEISDAEQAGHEKSFAPVMGAAFPDLHCAIEDVIAVGDRVVSRYLVTCTHRGEFMGIAATGKSVKIKIIWIHRLAGNRIVEGQDWGALDALGMLQQMGVSLVPESQANGEDREVSGEEGR